MCRFLFAACVLMACSSPEQPNEALPEFVNASLSDAPPAKVAAPVPKPIPKPGVSDDPAPVQSSTGTFDLSPLFASGPLATAIAKYHAGDNAAAARLFEAFVRKHPDDARARAARFMGLLSKHDAGIYDPTARDLEAMASRWPLLADYALFYAGSSHLKAQRPKKGDAVLAKIGPESTLHRRATEIRAKAMAKRGLILRAVRLLDKHVKERQGGRQETWLLMAKLKKERGDLKGARKAWLRVVGINADNAAGRLARKRLPPARNLTAAQALSLGRSLFKLHLHQEALKALRSAASRYKRHSPQYCEAILMEGKTYEKLKKRQLAWPLYESALKCRGKWRAKALFYAGRNRMKRGRLTAARTYLRKHNAEFPERTTADDSAVMLAEIARRRGQSARSDRILFKAISKYPKGDMADEIAWSLLWPHIAARRLTKARKVAEQLLRLKRREVASGAEGRTAYWYGWILNRLGQRTKAKKQWRKVIAEYPLSWYALLSLSRLAHGSKRKARKILASVVEASKQPSHPLAFSDSALKQDPHVQRSILFARMGLNRTAIREMKRWSTKISWKKRQWAKSLVFSATKRPGRATSLARQALQRHASVWPRGPNVSAWKLAYPKAYHGLVTRWSKARRIDPYWVWSVIRTESNFNADVVSWASAVGLMQIILPTARSLARRTGITVNRTTLKKPAISIRLGTKYLASLLRRNRNHSLASTGYNAGGGAIRKWRRAFGNYELDEFVERMPYSEARRYTKRVSSSRAAYHWLYEGNFPTLSLRAPGAI